MQTTFQNTAMHQGSTGTAVEMIDRMVEGCSDIEDQQVSWVSQDQSFAWTTNQRVANVAVTGVCCAGISNKKRIQIDLAKKICRMRAFMSS